MTARLLDMTVAAEQPAWRRPGVESHAWASVSVVAVGLLHLTLPDQLAALRAPEATGWTIVALAVALFLARKTLPREAARVLRIVSWVLIALVVVTNLVSLGLLVDDVVTAGTLDAADLLLGGVGVWATNFAAFGLLFWELDRGGPLARENGGREVPDLLFPQMTDPRLDRDFRPGFIDYLFVAFTNALAFSPTDTMPLSRWTKVLFAVESGISFGTLAVVAARAVNILPSS